MEERDRTAFAKAGSYAVFGAFRFLGMMVGALPMPLVRAAFSLAGMAAYAGARGRRETVKENMRRIRPGAGEREVRLLAMKSFVNYAHYWIDFLNSLYITPERIFRIVVPHGTDNFDIAREKGRGAILALPHYGSWELEGGFVGMKHMDFWAVAEVLDPPPMFRYHTRLRNRMGIKSSPFREHRRRGHPGPAQQRAGLPALRQGGGRERGGGGFLRRQGGVPGGPGPAGAEARHHRPAHCHTIRKGRHFHGYVGPPLEIGNHREHPAPTSRPTCRSWPASTRSSSGKTPSSGTCSNPSGKTDIQEWGQAQTLNVSQGSRGR